MYLLLSKICKMNNVDVTKLKRYIELPEPDKVIGSRKYYTEHTGKLIINRYKKALECKYTLYSILKDIHITYTYYKRNIEYRIKLPKPDRVSRGREYYCRKKMIDIVQRVRWGKDQYEREKKQLKQK